jgi:hypothetical protein
MVCVCDELVFTAIRKDTKEVLRIWQEIIDTENWDCEKWGPRSLRDTFSIKTAYLEGLFELGGPPNLRRDDYESDNNID